MGGPVSEGTGSHSCLGSTWEREQGGSLWLYDSRMPTIVPVKDRVVFSLRLPPDIYEALDGLADREERSLNNMTNVLVKEALRARGVLAEEPQG